MEKTARIQTDHIQVLVRGDGSVKNVYLIDKTNIHNNRLQVINQYEVPGARANRYDVTKYCVFDVDRNLLVMRPYQIVAAERILQRIETSTN